MFLFLKTRIVFWPCDDCYSNSYCCHGPVTIVISLVTVVMHLVSVFLLKFIFCLKLPCITIYTHMLPWIKHPCFTRDLGPLRPSFHHFLFLDFSPQVPVCKDHNSAPEGGRLSLWGGSPKENESARLLTCPASLVKIFPVVSLWCSNKSVRNLILLSSCSFAQLCPTLCEPMDCSTPGFSVLHHLLELAPTHVRLFSQVWPKLLCLFNDFPTLI